MGYSACVHCPSTCNPAGPPPLSCMHTQLVLTKQAVGLCGASLSPVVEVHCWAVWVPGVHHAADAGSKEGHAATLGLGSLKLSRGCAGSSPSRQKGQQQQQQDDTVSAA